MAIKVLITRKVPEGKDKELRPLLLKLRGLATSQDGYIYGETLRRFETSDEFLVISQWQSVDHWRSWEANAERKELQASIDGLLGMKTDYKIYMNV